MFEEIRIHGLGVIEDAELGLGPGLTVVTGETGAGKTMVVTGLSLLLGGRADAALVRPGSERAVVEGVVRVGPESAPARRAVEAGAELDDDTLVLRRTVTPEGRSRAHVGGAGAPVKLLGSLGEELVTVHGQSDQLRLLRPARQREFLDAYAGDGFAERLAAYRACFDRLRACEAELDELVTKARERAQEADLLRFGLSEIEAVEPEPGEDQALVAEEHRLAHADSLQAAADEARVALSGVDDATDPTEAGDALAAVAAARKALDAVRAHDSELAALSDRVAEAAFLLGDVAADLASYGAGIETDPARLQAVGERRAALAGLTRKYGETIDEVLAWSAQAASRLGELDGSDERIEHLRAQRASARAELGGLAAELSDTRTAAAARFGGAVSDELTALAMPNAVLTAEVRQTEVRQTEATAPDPEGDDRADSGRAGGQRRAAQSATGQNATWAAPDTTDDVAAQLDEDTAGDAYDGLVVNGRRLAFGPTGVDEVELLLQPHNGAPPRPVQRGASGGELSRVMLAVEVVFAGADQVPTFVFDEVDAGVGGRAAVEIGRRLAALATKAQVIVVTHLPQVAAFADRHYVVRKSEDGSITRSGLAEVAAAERVDELARMLAGLDDSASARAHAEELLQSAANAREEFAGSSGGRKKRKSRT